MDTREAPLDRSLAMFRLAHRILESVCGEAAVGFAREIVHPLVRPTSANSSAAKYHATPKDATSLHYRGARLDTGTRRGPCVQPTQTATPVSDWPCLGGVQIHLVGRNNQQRNAKIWGTPFALHRPSCFGATRPALVLRISYPDAVSATARSLSVPCQGRTGGRGSTCTQLGTCPTAGLQRSRENQVDGNPHVVLPQTA